MTDVVADTSGLISFGCVADHALGPLDLLVSEYDVAIPLQVRSELVETAQWNDTHGIAAQAVINRESTLEVFDDVEPDESMPLDEGERAAIALANGENAPVFFCDEYRNIAKVRMALDSSRLATTPAVLKGLVRRGELTRADGADLLDAIIRERGFGHVSYPNQARPWFEE